MPQRSTFNDGQYPELRKTISTTPLRPLSDLGRAVPHIAGGAHRYTPPRTTGAGEVGHPVVLYESQSTTNLRLSSTCGEGVITECAVAIRTE